jgi:hypothetical protein
LTVGTIIPFNKDMLDSSSEQLEMITRRLPDRWDSAYTTEYLLSLARGQEFMLPRNQYPKEIQFNSSWHRLLDNMHAISEKEDVECYAAIGAKEDKRSLYLPKHILRSQKGQVDHMVIRSTTGSMNLFGINHVVADVHTHPRNNPENTWDKFFSNTPEPRFSAGDLYGLAIRKSGLPMRIVIEGDSNLAVFASKETGYYTLDPNMVSQEQFGKYWYEKNGYKYNGISSNGESVTPLSFNATPGPEINQQIADEYKLVIYKGGTHEPLKKITP